MNLNTLKSKIAKKEIDTVLIVFPDVFGRLMGKRLTARYFIDQVAESATHGCNYLLTLNMEMDPQDGFNLASWEKGFGDFEMRPDLSTLRILPWQPATAFVLCDLHHHENGLVEEAPRTVLRRQVEALQKKGFICNIASELEFFLFNHTFHDASEKNYSTLTPSSDYRIDYHTMQTLRDEPILRALRNQMDEANIAVESSKGEWGRGQHELNFVYNKPLEMSDRHVLFKQGAKEIAEQNGKCLSFMAKIATQEAGSSCHIHISLWDKNQNLFWDNKTHGGSKLFKHFLGGLMKYSPELAYFYAPTINSYKRYQTASWAPTKMAWAYDNRTVGFRVVGHKNAFRIENRMPGADANPYLAFAAMMVAGMAGIEEKLECGSAYTGNAYIDKKLIGLPTSLGDAAERLNRSKLARKMMSDEVVDFYVHTARLEVQAYNEAVTDWELKRYFERI